MRIRFAHSVAAFTLTLGFTVLPAHDPPRPVPSFVGDFARMLPGSWRVDALRDDGGSSPVGRRTFVREFSSGVLFSWEEHDAVGVLRSRGFLGARDSLATQLYYMSVGPGMPPIAITGRVDANTRSIDWVLNPVVGMDHPYNQGLVVSRMAVLSADAFDWIAPNNWHLRFRRQP